MKIRFNNRDMLQALSKIQSFVPSNPVLPILENVLFEKDNDGLSISATDLENSIRVSGIDVLGDNFKVCVPFSIMHSTLKNLSDERLEMSISDTLGIEIKSSKGKYKFVGESHVDFPEFPENEESEKYTFDSDRLISSINKVKFATCNDELRPAMTGLYFGEHLVATDAHKLAEHKIDYDLGGVIISSKSISKISSINFTNSIEVSKTKSNVFFESGNILTCFRLIDSRYPNYKAVIPTNNPISVKLDSSRLRNSLNLLMSYTNKSTNKVVFDIDKNVLTLSATDLDYSNEATESINVESSDKIKIAFNSKYLIDILKNFVGDVTIEMSNPTRAAIIKNSEDFMCLIMPIML